MKLPRSTRHARNREAGIAVLVMLVLLSIILIYIAANTRVLNQLHQELKLTERHHLLRWNTIEQGPAPGATNVAAIIISTNTPEAPTKP